MKTGLSQRLGTVGLTLAMGLIGTQAAQAYSAGSAIGGLIGGAIGAHIGSQSGGYGGQIVGSAVGAAAGAAIGSQIGNRGYGYGYPVATRYPAPAYPTVYAPPGPPVYTVPAYGYDTRPRYTPYGYGQPVGYVITEQRGRGHHRGWYKRDHDEREHYGERYRYYR